eukprot:TRINITY_DN121318_c0_g1_i1.p1 TRINITY_DN121318_c0_g1~~TRINITY_DN121318_c0_g1_i1.p1  ORF type:complete len:384 (+),score=55.96 TRINITY_DN121318_c0_g1_i1:144-1295(+)
MHAQRWLQLIAGVAAWISCVSAAVNIYGHVRGRPTSLTACTVRILAVVPIFALDAWASLMLEASARHWSSPLSYIREVYESVAICSFLQYMLTVLGGPVGIAEKLRSNDAKPVHHVWPISVLVGPRRQGADFVSKSIIGIMQYVFVSLCLFCAHCLVWSPPWSEEESWFRESREFIAIGLELIKSVSCGCAMYNLALFYRHTYDHLLGIQPILKFLSIKGVVFFTFWQGVVIALIASTGVIPDNGGDDGHGHKIWTRNEYCSGLRDFLLCLEMVIFAEMHRRAYPVPSDEEAAAFKFDADKLGALPLQDIRQLCRETVELQSIARNEAEKSGGESPPTVHGTVVGCSKRTSEDAETGQQELATVGLPVQGSSDTTGGKAAVML